jgi:multidrug efflux system membrane fusion protein
MNDVKPLPTLTMLLLPIAAGACAVTEAIPQAPQAVQTQRVGSVADSGGAGGRYSAVVEPESEVLLSFRIPGYVTGLKQVRGENGMLRDVDEGDAVGKGDVLVRIRAAEYEDKVRQATSQAAAAEAVALKARLDFERATRLYGSQSLTKPDLDAARSQYDASESELRAARAVTSEAEIALRDTSVVAPFAGDIVKKNVEPGSFVGPGTTVFAVANTETVKIIVGVPDTTVRSIRLGQPVDVTVDAFANRSFRARISRIASAADLKTRNFEVEVAIPNRDHVLRVGMIGSLSLDLGPDDAKADLLHVPLSAIVQANDGKYGVFVVAASESGKIATLRPVEIGRVIGTDISIVSGLASGDEVITTGATLLKDGQRVEVLK